MPLYDRWRHKPPPGARIDRSHNLANGLLGFWALNEAAGSINVDSVNSTTLTQAGGANLLGCPGQVGPGLSTNGSNWRSQASWPASLQAPWPLTFITAFSKIGNQASSGLVFGLWPSPLGILFQSGTQTITNFRNSGNAAISTLTTATGGTYVVAWEQASNTSGRWYINGNLDNTSATNIGAASYSTPNVAFGDSTSFANRTSGCVHHWGGIWSRVLSASEHAAIGSNVNAVWQMFAPQSQYWLFNAAAAAAFKPAWAVESPVLGSGIV